MARKHTKINSKVLKQQDDNHKVHVVKHAEISSIPKFFKKESKKEEGLAMPVTYKNQLKRYVRSDRVEQFKKDGWKVIDSDFSDISVNHAVRAGIKNNQDLFLMVKEQ